MDIEASNRKLLINILRPFFECFEEVDLATSAGGKVRADVVGVSEMNCEAPVVLAFEVKSHNMTDPGKFKDALFQASKYVNATIITSRTRIRFADLRVDAAAVFPAPVWHYPGKISEFDGNALFLSGIAFFAERLNVGRVVPRRKDWEIAYGPNEIWTKNKGWMGNAVSRFPSKRIATNLSIQIANEGTTFD